MTIGERLRLSIHTKLSELIGNDETIALITHIMPVPWNDVATNDQLRLTAAQLRAETATLGAELRTEMAELRTEMAELRTEMAELRTEVRTEITGLRGDMMVMRSDLLTQLHQGMAMQTRWLAGYMTALSAVMLTVARLLF